MVYTITESTFNFEFYSASWQAIPDGDRFCLLGHAAGFLDPPFSDYPLWSLYSVLWLLGAYCELLKLTTIRANALNREDYYLQLRSLKLVGGGFSEFESLQRQIYTILENTNYEDGKLIITIMIQCQSNKSNTSSAEKER